MLTKNHNKVTTTTKCSFLLLDFEVSFLLLWIPQSGSFVMSLNLCYGVPGREKNTEMINWLLSSVMLNSPEWFCIHLRPLMLLITIFFFNRCNILEAYIESSWVPIKSDTDHEIQTLSSQTLGNVSHYSSCPPKIKQNSISLF